MIWISTTSVDISPIEAVYLGCGTGEKVSPENILDRLEANILVAYSSDKKSKVVIISVDTLFFGPSVSRAILSGLSEEFDEKEVFLAATHTHTAPMVDETKPRLGKRNDDYADLLVSRVVESTLGLIRQEPIAVSVSFWKSKLGGIVSRRKIRAFGISRYGIKRKPIFQRPNFKAYSHSIESTFVEFTDEKGNVLSSIGVIPCHAVAYQGQNVISSDLVGAIRAELNKQGERKTSSTFIFLQGASGDLNPWLKGHLFRGGIVGLIDQILNGFQFPSFTAEELSAWSAARVREILLNRPASVYDFRAMNLGRIGSELQETPLSVVLEDSLSIFQRAFHLQKVQLESLNLIGVSAEVTWEFKEQLIGSIGNATLVGCLRDPFGYVCSEEQYSEGGYEARDHQDSFSIHHFKEGIPANKISPLL